jgi:hypothetical protein
MKIYFAGSESRIFRDILIEGNVNNFLISFAIIDNQKSFNKWVDGAIDLDKIDLFLDCGAFSAFTRGLSINIDDYIAFIKNTGIKIYASLDVIGDDQKTYDNFVYMRERGLDPIPCFHTGEDYSFLDKYCSMTDYIALGGLAGGRSLTYMKKHLDYCFHVIGKHWPKKIHGFGLTSYNMLKAYPFFSSDSTTWLSSAKYGHIIGDNLKAKRGAMSKYLTRTKGYKKVVYSSIAPIQRAEESLTKLWEKRGIKWQ